MNTTPADREQLLKRVTAASVCTALFLVLIKTAAWLADGSVSILASLADSFTDAAASIVNLIAVRFSLKPADAGHPFGHGKAEGLSAMTQAALIGGSAVFLMMHTAERLFAPEPLHHTGWGIFVMLVSIACTFALVRFQKNVLKQTDCAAVEADSLHYLSDLLSNGAALLALILTALGWAWADVLIGLLIALWVLKSAWSIAADALGILMDESLPPAETERIRAAALSAQGVLGIHDLRTRKAGGRKIIEMHLDIDGNLSLRAAHAIGMAAADKVRAELGDAADITVHHDPADTGKTAV